MSINYSTIQVSKKAREYALILIDFYALSDTHQLGFWLGIPLGSDYIALAIYAEKCLKEGTVKCPQDVAELAIEEVPKDWYFI